MKVIPKDELMLIISECFCDEVFSTSMESLFENYGDDYYKDHGIAEWELCNENKMRKGLIGAIIEDE